MDRNALDWLFSTAPQALAALVGLIFTGVAFILGTIDKEVSRDETRKDIIDEMKREIHVNMKNLYWLAGLSVVIDLVLIIINPVEDNLRYSFKGAFDPYLLIAGIVIFFNIITLIYSLWFIVHVANPEYFQNTVARMSKAVTTGNVESKEFLLEFIEMEKVLRELYVHYSPQQGQRPFSIIEMARNLQYQQLLDSQDMDKITSVVHLRNLIVHGADISYVESDKYNDVKNFKKKFIELNKSFVFNRTVSKGKRKGKVRTEEAKNVVAE